MMKNYLIKEVRVLWMACMNSSTKLKMYIMAISTEVLAIMELVIISMESPIMRHISVVTLLAIELKKLTLGNKHMPNKA